MQFNQILPTYQSQNSTKDRHLSFHSMEFACLVIIPFQNLIHSKTISQTIFLNGSQRRHSVTFLIHPSNCTSRFVHFTFVIVIDWLQSIHTLKGLSVCVCSLKNCYKRMSHSFGHISVSFKSSRKSWLISYIVCLLKIASNENCSFNLSRIRIVFKWLIRAFSGHLPPDELLILWDLVFL